MGGNLIEQLRQVKDFRTKKLHVFDQRLAVEGNRLCLVEALPSPDKRTGLAFGSLPYGTLRER